MLTSYNLKRNREKMLFKSAQTFTNFSLFLSIWMLINKLPVAGPNLNVNSDISMVENLYFGATLQNNVFRKILHISIGNCQMQCVKRMKCKSYNYRQKLLLCELNTEDFDSRPGDFQWSSTTIYSQKIDWVSTNTIPGCEKCRDTEVCEIINTEIHCLTSECEPLPRIQNAEQKGNIVAIGAKVEYQCTEDTNMYGSVSHTECNVHGAWSKMDFTCSSCLKPVAPSWAPIRIMYMNATDAGYHAYFTCTDSNKVPRNSPMRCSEDLQKYKYIYACCEEPSEPPWHIVYRISSNTYVQSESLWNKQSYHDAKASTLQNCTFRDNKILDNWESSNIEEVKVEITANNSVQAWLIFDGIDTDMMSWYSQAKLINSSWGDLKTADFSNGIFSLTGFSKMSESENDRKKIRFYIGSQPNFTDCTQDFLWFGAVHAYQCPPFGTNIVGTVQLLYSKLNAYSSFEDNIGKADIMEIFVKMKNV